MADQVTDALTQVFANVDAERRAQLIAWASEELGTRSIVTMATDTKDHTWKVGETSPCNDTLTIFAMLLDLEARACDVYTFGFVEENGQQGVLYFKETIWNLEHTYGPIGIDALYLEWRSFFTGVPPGGVPATPTEDEDDDEPDETAQQQNGRA